MGGCSGVVGWLGGRVTGQLARMARRRLEGWGAWEREREGKRGKESDRFLKLWV
jgi:hypothetical protein